MGPRGRELLLDPRQVRVGQTPSEVVYSHDKLRLLHYLPQGPSAARTPLLMVYALINRPYILDLLPGRSVVEHFVRRGFDVYLLDWGVPDEAERFLTLHHYINRYLHGCIRQVKALTGAPKVSLLGYCQGGTFTAIYTALHPNEVKNLMLLAAPFDFSVQGILHLWARKEYLDVDKLVDTYGNIPPWLLSTSFTMLRPVQNLLDKYVHFFQDLSEDRMDDGKLEQFLAVEKWLAESIPHPGEVYREFVKGLYQENRLMRGQLRLNGTRVDCKKIKCPILNIIAEEDHIIPPDASRPFNAATGSKEQTTLAYRTGHVGLSIGSAAQRVLWPKAVEWLAARS